jgi:hypothetical protein
MRKTRNLKRIPIPSAFWIGSIPLRLDGDQGGDRDKAGKDRGCS